MPPHILVVDNDPAFAQMLCQTIIQALGYTAEAAVSAKDAWSRLARAEFDMAIIDTGLQDTIPLEFVREVRRRRPTLRLVLIPLEGEELDDSFRTIEVQGVLPKPFFFDDLQAILRQAVESQPAAARPEERPAVSTSPAPTTVSRDQAIIRVVGELQRELVSEAVLLVGPMGVALASGEIGRVEPEALAPLLRRQYADSQEIMGLLGEAEEAGVYHGYLEGGRRRIYWQAVRPGWLLACVLGADTPLGILRYHMRQAAERLAGLLT
ncbi:MAG: response regulator [Anaerolineae bacterium]